MVKATEVVYKYYEVEFALKRGNNDALAWFGLFLAGINKSWAKLGGMPSPRLIVIDLVKTAKRGFLRLKISTDYSIVAIIIISSVCIIHTYL